MYKSKRSLKVYVIFHLIMSVFDFNRVRIASLIMSVLEFDYF